MSLLIIQVELQTDSPDHKDRRVHQVQQDQLGQEDQTDNLAHLAHQDRLVNLVLRAAMVQLENKELLVL